MHEPPSSQWTAPTDAEIEQLIQSWLDSKTTGFIADKSRAESALADMYAEKSLDKPLFVWCRSLWQMAALVLSWNSDRTFKPAYIMAELESDTQYLWKKLVSDIERQELEAKFRKFPVHGDVGIATVDPIDLEKCLAFDAPTFDRQDILSQATSAFQPGMVERMEEVFNRLYWLPKERWCSASVNERSLIFREVLFDMVDKLTSHRELAMLGLMERWSKANLSNPHIYSMSARLEMISIRKNIKEKFTQSETTNKLTINFTESVATGYIAYDTMFLQFLRETFFTEPIMTKQLETWTNAWSEITKTTCGFIPLRDLVLVSERAAYNFDDRERFHSRSNPAITFGDNFKMFYIHGKLVDKRLIENPHTITISDITKEDNFHMRDLLLEQADSFKIVEQPPTRTLDRDETSVLYSLPLIGQDNYTMFKWSEGNTDHFREVSPRAATVKDARSWLEFERTREQRSERELEKMGQQWIDLARSTERIDRAKLETAVEQLYALSQLPKPRIVICQSPWQLLVLPAVLMRLPGLSFEAAQSRAPEHSQLWKSLYMKCQEAFGTSMEQIDPGFCRQQIGSLSSVMKEFSSFFYKNDQPELNSNDKRASLTLNKVFGRVTPQTGQRFAEEVRAANGMINDFGHPLIQETVRGNQMWAHVSAARVLYTEPGAECEKTIMHNLCYFIEHNVIAWDALRHLGIRFTPREETFIDRCIELAHRAPMYLFFENTCFVSERPLQRHLDDHNRLHNETGPALSYTDGFEHFMVRGIEIPPYVIRNPEQITLSTIQAEQNAAVRHIMLSNYGEERFLKDANAELIQEDHCGALFRVWFEDEPLVMVRVQDPPTQSGEQKFYYLRVPPDMMTAEQAVAWTFGMESPEEYRPDIQT